MVAANFPVLAINLDRDTARRTAIAGQLDAHSLPWERVPAFDGSDPADFAAASTNYDANANRHRWRHSLTAGEIACFASHRRAWEIVVERNCLGAVIVEDDALLTPRFPGAVATLRATHGKWQAVKLFTNRPRAVIAQTALDCVEIVCVGGGGGNAGAQPEELTSAKVALPPVVALRYAFCLGDYFKTPVCTTGYAVSFGAAKKLLAATAPFFRPADVQLQRYWETGIRFQALLPYPVLENPAFTGASTLDAERRQKRRAERRPLVNLADQLLFNIHSLARAIHRHGLLNTLAAKSPLNADTPSPPTAEVPK
ncbi:MAG: glycosyltransferase family 25 protein [Puniceicoccales bacterium]|jgi:glycosyl transferase family 25|nr:glycosyltransferase family 25 protein [Puniceicoccales bacterium]